MDAPRLVSKAVRECRNQAGTAAMNTGASHQARAPEGIPQSQTQAEREDQRHQRANSACKPNGTRHKRRQQLQIHGQAEVILPAVLKVDREKAAQAVPHPTRDEVHRGHGLHGFVGEEKNWEFVQLDEAREQIEQKAAREQPIFHSPGTQLAAVISYQREFWS